MNTLAPFTSVIHFPIVLLLCGKDDRENEGREIKGKKKKKKKKYHVTREKK